MKRLTLKLLLAAGVLVALAAGGSLLLRETVQRRWLEEDLLEKGRLLFTAVMENQDDSWRMRRQIARNSTRLWAEALGGEPDNTVTFLQQGGIRRLQIGSGAESLGLLLRRPDTPEEGPRRVAGAYPRLRTYTQALGRSVFDTYFISREGWTAVLPAQWAMENEPRPAPPGAAAADPAPNAPPPPPSPEPRMSGFYYDRTLKKWMVSLRAPVVRDNRSLGVSGHDIAVEQLLDDIRPDRILPGTGLFITDAALGVILHPDLAAAYRQPPVSGRPPDFDALLRDPVARQVTAAARERPFSERFFSRAGRRVLALSRRQPDTGWRYFFLIDVARMTRAGRRAADASLWLFAGGLAVLLLLVLLFLHFSFLKPLHELGHSLGRSGDRPRGAPRRRRTPLSEINRLFAAIDSVFVQLRDAADEARQADERTETLLRTAQFIVVTLDPQLRLTRINDYGLKRLGLPAGDAPAQRHAADFLDPAFLADLPALLAQQDSLINHETRLTLPSGEKLEVEMSVARTVDGGGRPSGYVAVIADITGRKRAETDLRNQIAFSQQVFTSIPEMILIVDPQLRITFINKQARDRLHAQAVGQPLMHFLPKRSVENGFDEQVRNVIASGPGFNQINTLNPFAEEETFVDLVIEPLVSGGRRIGAILLLRDISEWRNLTGQLHALQGFMQKLINASPFAVISVNSDHVVTTWNQSAEKMLGISFEVAFGKNLFDLRLPFARYRDAIHEAMILKKTSFHADEKLMVGDENFIVANLTFYPVTTAEQSGVVVHIEDLSELKRLESSLLQAQKMESLGVLASGMIHDFNNVLSGILGYASLLDKKIGTDPKLKKYVTTIINSSERASNLIGQILNYSRKKLTEKEIVDVNEILKESIDFISFNLRTVRVDLQLAAGKLLLNADKTRISQTLINLILNARDAVEKTADPGITIRTELEIVQGHAQLIDGQYVRVTIQDNGHGISPENLQKVFEPFFTTKGKGKGTGLGLAMVREIIVDYHGHIDVESAIGKGTAFRILLPALSQDALQPVLPTAEEGALTPLEGTVLLVDDEEVVREIGSDMLKTIGLECLTAENGEQAMAVFGEHRQRIDLVILDIEMPVMSGDKAARKMRELDPGVRILIASGYTREYLESNVFHGPIDHFIPKPFKIEQLSYQVRRLLQGGPRDHAV